jgi:hypothetical protein
MRQDPRRPPEVDRGRIEVARSKAGADMRTLLGILSLLTLLLAPAGVARTHGPADALVGVGTQDHGHGHDLVPAATPSGQAHDAGDHEHQIQAILTRAGGIAAGPHSLPAPSAATEAPGHVPDGPRRPPRIGSA